MNAIALIRVLALTITLLCVAPGLARAANCTSPAGAEGSIIYNADHHLPQYCNGTAWVGMVGIGGGGGGGADNLGNHTATQNIVLGSYWLSGDGGDEGIIVDSTGKVGIGVTNPSEKLEISGRIRANAYYNSSDRRLKHDIEPLEGKGLELVRKLRGVSFVWNETGKKALGFIAQEVEAVVPFAVATDAKGMKSVDYVMMIAPMAEAIKSLDADNARLRAALRELAAQQAADKADLLREIAAIKANLH